MAKRCVCVFLSVVLLAPLSGCWDYHSLSDITIVAGVAIDRDSPDGDYRVTCEIIDTNIPVKDKGIQSKLVESSGKTVFDAVRNAKRRVASKLYFSNTEVIIVCKNIAEQEGLHGIFDWFLRDSELRETLQVVVSQEKTAKDLLTVKGLDNTVVSYEIQKIVQADQKTTSSIEVVPLFKAYNKLVAPCENLTLPAFHKAVNNDQEAVEANGQCVFKKGKMVGYLSPEETKYYLFAVGGVHGGILTDSFNNKKDDIALEIASSRVNVSFSDEDGLRFKVETETNVYLDESHTNIDVLDEEEIEKLESAASDELAKKIAGVILKVQKAYGSDIFGFGNLVCIQNPQLWKQSEENWNETFSNLPVAVVSKVHILNTAYIK